MTARPLANARLTTQKPSITSHTPPAGGRNGGTTDSLATVKELLQIYNPHLIGAACNQPHNWIQLVNIHLDIGFSPPNDRYPPRRLLVSLVFFMNLISSRSHSLKPNGFVFNFLHLI